MLADAKFNEKNKTLNSEKEYINCAAAGMFNFHHDPLAQMQNVFARVKELITHILGEQISSPMVLIYNERVSLRAKQLDHAPTWRNAR